MAKKESGSRLTIAGIMCIVIGLALGIVMKRLPIGLLIGLTLGLLSGVLLKRR